jgi:asparagine synthase (glutamine-hydrolysing)
MVAAIRHRGPDDEGVEFRPFGNRFLGLGFRRLSILDLSAAGHQPMVHPQSGSCLIFNGEIYNFARLREQLQAEGQAFVGHGDTEVLLHALERWGPGCLSQLQGMFALAWLDARSQRLILARDSVGIKPLFVFEAPGATLFASEVQAILASGVVPRRIDRRGLVGLLAFGVVQQPCTIVQSVRVFPAGHWQVLETRENSSAERPQPFFRFPAPESKLSGPDAVDAVRTTLADAVRDHLVSDVPVGVFLSSGLDSTILATLAARFSPHMRSFTVGFQDQSDFSELRLAAETARGLELEHTEININEPQALGQVIKWLEALDQPCMDGLNVYLISQAVRAAGVTVALSGQGGDELFGGYPSFQDVPRLRRFRRASSWLPPPLRQRLFATAGMGKNTPVRDKLHDLSSGSSSILALYLHRRRTLSNRQLADLGVRAGEPGLSEEFQPLEALSDLPVDEHDPVWLISQLESRFYQGNMLLPETDANSMAHGLEVRVPMLDQRLLDLVLALPGQVRLPQRKANKYLLRQAFAPALRPELLQQKKRGFTLPIARWLRGELRNFSETALRSLKVAGILENKGVDAVWKGYLDEPESPMWSRAFTLVVLGQYLKKTGLT